MTNAAQAMQNFEARIWEKAEHWTFDVTLEATDEVAARAQLKKDYPARSYSVRSVQSFYRAPQK
jgi:hypothetical protein